MVLEPAVSVICQDSCYFAGQRLVTIVAYMLRRAAIFDSSNSRATTFYSTLHSRIPKTTTSNILASASTRNSAKKCPTRDPLPVSHHQAFLQDSNFTTCPVPAYSNARGISTLLCALRDLAELHTSLSRLSRRPIAIGPTT